MYEKRFAGVPFAKQEVNRVRRALPAAGAIFPENERGDYA